MKTIHYMLILCGVGVLGLGAGANAQEVQAPQSPPPALQPPIPVPVPVPPGATDTSASEMAPNGQAAYGELASLVSQIAILKAKVQIAQLKRDIAQAEGGSIPGVSASSAPSPDYQARYPQGVENPDLVRPQGVTGANITIPRVLSISGQGQQLHALLLMPDGGEVEVAPGTLLDNGAIVSSVLPTSVRVMLHGQVSALPFVGVGGSAYAPGG